jgi:type I restriction enzyme, S subunit
VIEGLKPYPAYRDSGPPWLGRIPDGWEIRRNGRNFAQRNEAGSADLPILEVSIRTGVRVRDLASSARKQVMADREKYKRAHAGDIAYNMMRMWQGAVGVVPEDGLISPAYVVARPYPGVCAEYFAYLFRTPDYMQVVENASRGIVSDRNRLYWDSFKQIASPFPPPDEQRAIVRFLDHADRRIRRYVRAKQRLIKLLEEQKRAILHDALTRDLAGGQHILLGRCLDPIEQGWSPVAAEGDLSDEQWAVLTLSAIRRGRFNGGALKPIRTSATVPPELAVEAGDLLLTRSNTRSLVGDACVVDRIRPRTIFSDLIYRLRTDPTKLHPRFLMYQLLSPRGREQIERDARGSSGTMPKIAQAHIRSWKITIAPIDEQARLIERIEQRIARVDQAVGATEREISLITEYRARLIADVVTGKLDVRDAAARLPDELPDDVSADGESTDAEDAPEPGTDEELEGAEA